MILETERLLLRKPRMNDWKDIVDGCNDLETARYVLPMPYPYKKKHAVSWIRKCKSDWSKKVKETMPFFIELKDVKKVIGAIDLTHINIRDRVCQTGSWIHRNFRKQGYITEAKIAVNEYAFNKLKMRKMETGVFDINEASRATQESVGYRYEGRRIKSKKCLATGKIHDELLFGMMKSDWKKMLPKLKAKLRHKIMKLDLNKG